MKRITMLVAAAVLMVVLSATTVSPAFANDPNGRGYGNDPSYKWCGGPQCDELWGWACGANKPTAYKC